LIQLMPPETFELSRPFVKRPDRIGIGPIQPSPAVAADVDETNLQQHAQVFRHRRLLKAQGSDDVSDWAFLESEIVQYFAAARFGDRVEGIRRRSGSWHGANITFPYGNMSMAIYEDSRTRGAKLDGRKRGCAPLTSTAKRSYSRDHSSKGSVGPAITKVFMNITRRESGTTLSAKL
jgi:hypothetical protein